MRKKQRKSERIRNELFCYLTQKRFGKGKCCPLKHLEMNFKTFMLFSILTVMNTIEHNLCLYNV